MGEDISELSIRNRSRTRRKLEFVKSKEDSAPETIKIHGMKILESGVNDMLMWEKGLEKYCGLVQTLFILYHHPLISGPLQILMTTWLPERIGFVKEDLSCTTLDFGFLMEESYGYSQ